MITLSTATAAWRRSSLTLPSLTLAQVSLSQVSLYSSLTLPSLTLSSLTLLKSHSPKSHSLKSHSTHLFSHMPHRTSPTCITDMRTCCFLQLPNGLAFGGRIDERYFGLWLRSDLETGRSDTPCSTFHSPMLSSAAEFKVELVEVWAVQAHVDAQHGGVDAWGVRSGGVLSEEHAEAAHFIGMTGRMVHRDTDGRAARNADSDHVRI